MKAAPECAAPQSEITAQITSIAADYQRAGRQETQPRLDYPPYRSSRLRHPASPMLRVDPEDLERGGPCFGREDVDPGDADLTAGHPGEPIGERIIVTGRVLDGSGRPVAGQLVEVWQANASGRYRHQRDQHPAPIDPNFTGVGRCLTGPDGTYRFLTIKPGPYPWRNHRNAWRPAHIHFSLFGTAFTQRLVTQMYFPGDPLFGLDPIYQSIVDPVARRRLIAGYDHDLTSAEYATGYRWDIVLAGSGRTWIDAVARMPELACTPGQTVGPFFGCALPYPGDRRLVDHGHPGAIRLHGTIYDGADNGVPDALVELWQPDPDGNIAHQAGSLRRDGSAFTGWGRAATDAAGHYDFTTLLPGSASAGRPAYFALTVFARGLLNRLFTRVYLPDANPDADPLLATLDAARRDTLVCAAETGGYRFDIHLQGEHETVFLAFRGDPT